MRTVMASLVMAAGAALSAPALAADCNNPQTSTDVVACLEQELRESDRSINEAYQELRGKLDEKGKLRLRDEQRAWLRKRDAACGLDTKESDRERWLRAILRDYKKTVCVVRFTRARNSQLADVLAVYYGGAKSDDYYDQAQNGLADNARYEVSSPNAHQTGKWYFEVWVDVGDVARTAETALWVGVDSDGGGMGNLINVRRNDAGKPPLIYGMAVDLANGKLYGRTDGTWHAVPGSAQGLDIKLGRAYRAEITSSAEITALVDRKLIDVNFGDRPFAYALPDGYRPFAAK